MLSNYKNETYLNFYAYSLVIYMISYLLSTFKNILKTNLFFNLLHYPTIIILKTLISVKFINHNIHQLLKFQT